jgi:hypothetical protein
MDTRYGSKRSRCKFGGARRPHRVLGARKAEEDKKSGRSRGPRTAQDAAQRLIRHVVLTASCLAATVAPAQPAIAQTGSIEPVRGTLLAKGAAVRITFTYTCTTFEGASEQFQITQRAGSSVAKGTSRFLFVGDDLLCNGEQNTAQVDIAAEDNRFKKGPAHVSATGDIGNFQTKYGLSDTPSAHSWRR